MQATPQLNRTVPVSGLRVNGSPPGEWDDRMTASTLLPSPLINDVTAPLSTVASRPVSAALNALIDQLIRSHRLQLSQASHGTETRPSGETKRFIHEDRCPGRSCNSRGSCSAAYPSALPRIADDVSSPRSSKIRSDDCVLGSPVFFFFLLLVLAVGGISERSVQCPSPVGSLGSAGEVIADHSPYWLGVLLTFLIVLGLYEG